MVHLLQSPCWGALKSQFGWTRHEVLLTDRRIPAQILFRSLPAGLKLAYVPKGPPVDWHDPHQRQQALRELPLLARRRGVLFLKVEPDALPAASLQTAFREAGFVPARPVQPVNTIVLDITPPEEAILAAMKSKTRYNIRLAARKGVQVREGTADDLPTFFRLVQITARRDGFAVHTPDYYRTAYHAFPPENRALLLATFRGEPLAALMVFAWGEQAYYLYGASSNEHRDKMPTYLLQWEAIRWARGRGCRRYDLWGIPDAPPDQLEAEFLHRRDGLWGVYRFKRGFGGQVVRSIGAFDYVYHPRLYALFTKLLERRMA